MVPHYEPGEKVELLIPPSYTLPVNKLMIWKENYVLTGNKVFFPSINPRIIIVLTPLEQ